MGIKADLAEKLDESPKIIANWRDAWKLHSVQAQAVGLLFNAASAAAAQAFGAATLIVVWPFTTVLVIGAALFAAGLIGRLLVQPRLAGKINETDQGGA